MKFIKWLFNYKKCWTGRRWISIRSVHIGFGPKHIIERIQVKDKLVFVSRK